MARHLQGVVTLDCNIRLVHGLKRSKGGDIIINLPQSGKPKFNYYVKGHAFSFLNLGFYSRPFFRTYHSAADLSSASLTMLEEGNGLKSRARGGRELIFTNFKNNKPLAKSKNSNLKASFKCENYKRGVGER